MSPALLVSEGFAERPALCYNGVIPVGPARKQLETGVLSVALSENRKKYFPFSNHFALLKRLSE